jgi:hypothetical membrane protein
MEARMQRWAWHLGSIAAAFAAVALLAGGASIPGFSHATDPVAVLGSAAAPQAAWFNLAGRVVPGVAIAGLAIVLERALDRAAGSRTLRIGTGLLLIAGLAFAAQGLMPVDLSDLDGAASRRHAALHAAAQLAWIAAAVMLCAATWRMRGWRAPMLIGLGFAVVLGVDMLAPLTTWTPGLRGAPGAVERAMLALWLLWPILIGCRGARTAAQARP